jgi:uncharacterized protein (DUF433 family)
MADHMIHYRGRGPEIVGTRITVYNLLPDFLDPTKTEAAICRAYDLNSEQVAAARAYVLNHADEVLARHLEIEERMAAGNSPELIEQAKRAHARFQVFREWLANRQRAEAKDRAAELNSETGRNGTGHFPTFREWLQEQESSPAAGK